ncbi:MAG: hypothetical protein QOJ51_3526, partial [Acidobacteriaceae bacterium]|nr:hypothetical protein [Acidobacteriaceae bacterium]
CSLAADKMSCGMPAAYSIFRKTCHAVADSETWQGISVSWAVPVAQLAIDSPVHSARTKGEKSLYFRVENVSPPNRT